MLCHSSSSVATVLYQCSNAVGTARGGVGVVAAKHQPEAEEFFYHHPRPLLLVVLYNAADAARKSVIAPRRAVRQTICRQRVYCGKYAQTAVKKSPQEYSTGEYSTGEYSTVQGQVATQSVRSVVVVERPTIIRQQLN